LVNEQEGGRIVGREMALGLTDDLDRFAARHGVEVWRQFAAGDLLNWRFR